MISTITKLFRGLSCFGKGSKDKAAAEAPKESSKARPAESRSSRLPPQMVPLPPSPVRARRIPRSAGNGRRPLSVNPYGVPLDDADNELLWGRDRDLERYGPAWNLARAPHQLTVDWKVRLE
jgi:hypothetical protein